MSPGSSLLLHGGVASPRFFKPPPPFNEYEKAVAAAWGRDGFAVERALDAWIAYLVQGTDKNPEDVKARVRLIVAKDPEGETSPAALICELNMLFREPELELI